MDLFTVLLFLLFPFLWAIFHTFTSKKFSRSPNLLPPGPSPLPVIGNILDLGTKPHESLFNLSKRYGPIMTLKLGTKTTIVISSFEMAKQVLHTNDLAFSSRTVPDTAASLGHDKFSVVWMSASDKWRSLRRACSTELFSPKRLDSTQSLRQKKAQELLDFVEEQCKKGEAVDIAEAAFTTALNSISNTFFSMDFAHYSSDKSQEFKDTIWGIMVEAGTPNVVDYFPLFRRLDPQGARKRMDYYFGKLLKFFDGILDEKMRLRASKTDSEISNDVMDSFLNHMIDGQLTREEVLHLFLVSPSALIPAILPQSPRPPRAGGRLFKGFEVSNIGLEIGHIRSKFVMDVKRLIIDLGLNTDFYLDSALSFQKAESSLKLF